MEALQQPSLPAQVASLQLAPEDALGWGWGWKRRLGLGMVLVVRAEMVRVRGE
jgi:hypothetical protein